MSDEANALASALVSQTPLGMGGSSGGGGLIAGSSPQANPLAASGIVGPGNGPVGGPPAGDPMAQGMERVPYPSRPGVDPSGMSQMIALAQALGMGGSSLGQSAPQSPPVSVNQAPN